jgi:hypothetical protein
LPPDTTEGITAEGITAEGVTADGVTAEGITAEGVTAEGITAEGVTTEGVPAVHLSVNKSAGGGVHLHPHALLLHTAAFEIVVQSPPLHPSGVGQLHGYATFLEGS